MLNNGYPSMNQINRESIISNKTSFGQLKMKEIKSRKTSDLTNKTLNRNEL